MASKSSFPFRPRAEVDETSAKRAAEEHNGREPRKSRALETNTSHNENMHTSNDMQLDEADSEPDSDPEDPIIRILPVFLTPALTDSLALLQYPHRPPALHTQHPLLPPSLRPSDDERDTRPQSHKVTARYKPKVGQLELSVPLEISTGGEKSRYNVNRASDLGRGIQETDLGENGSGKSSRAVNGRGKNDSLLAYEEGNDTPLERISLAGETIPDQTWYACATVKDSKHCSALHLYVSYLRSNADEVHLTPLTRTMQLRANLSYLDRINALDRQNTKRERRVAEGAIESDDGVSDSDGGFGEDGTEPVAKTAADAAAKKAKRIAAEKKKAASDVKISLSSFRGPQTEDSGRGFNATGDMKTGRAAASLFGPLKAAEQEQWIDLPYYDPTVLVHLFEMLATARLMVLRVQSDEANAIYDKLFAHKEDKLTMITKATSYLKL